MTEIDGSELSAVMVTMEVSEPPYVRDGGAVERVARRDHARREREALFCAQHLAGLVRPRIADGQRVAVRIVGVHTTRELSSMW